MKRSRMKQGAGSALARLGSRIAVAASGFGLRLSQEVAGCKTTCSTLLLWYGTVIEPFLTARATVWYRGSKDPGRRAPSLAHRPHGHTTTGRAPGGHHRARDQGARRDRQNDNKATRSRRQPTVSQNQTPWHKMD
jgi:hypothetical protein